MHVHRGLILLAGLVLAAGCKKEKAKDTGGTADIGSGLGSAPPPPPVKKEPTAETFGKTIGPFGAVAKLKLGMSEADAKAAAPELWDDKGTKAVEVDGLSYLVGVTNGTLDRIKIENRSSKDTEPLLVTAWGEALVAKDILGGDIKVWLDPATGTKVVADNGDLELTRYLPVDQLLGPDPVAIAALPKPILGATLDELRRDYPEAYVGTAPDEKTLHLLPTAWDSQDSTTVWPMILQKGEKVRDFHFEIPDKTYPPGKDENLSLFKKKWGEPKLKKAYGSDTETMIFHAKNPLIEVERTVHDEGWEIRIRPKDDACGGPCYKGL